ncbi:S-layer homology domain-containing protein [Saccharibacillus brassicae]|uniref:S-layer homology domain-containing protein n=1 Tax=Saccharibacillus brassicae TaxID=2583377 RepID=A0A4Y6UVE1_SACBS|nr:S-layer homology domain-containing protein [Saccharibacillus brassicae]QDH20311.1 S-layer homology domain-containing protein [Saccharibacillus brassicae]
MSVVQADGTVRPLKAFSKPVTLRLRADGNSPQKPDGIYAIAENGSLEYMGGTQTDSGWTAQVDRSGRYGLLRYDKSFDDVPASYWAHEAIRRMAARQIVQGFDGASFAPKRDVTRAEFAALIARALDLDSAKPNPFRDIDARRAYAPAIAAVFEAGIAGGRSRDTFGPEDTLSREEMAVMLMNAYRFRAGREASSAGKRADFKDVDDVGKWAQESVSAAKNLGLMQGRGGDRFMPQATVSRAETAQAVSLLLDKTAP